MKTKQFNHILKKALEQAEALTRKIQTAIDENPTDAELNLYTAHLESINADAYKLRHTAYLATTEFKAEMKKAEAADLITIWRGPIMTKWAGRKKPAVPSHWPEVITWLIQTYSHALPPTGRYTWLDLAQAIKNTYATQDKNSRQEMANRIAVIAAYCLHQYEAGKINRTQAARPYRLLLPLNSPDALSLEDFERETPELRPPFINDPPA